MPRKQWRFPITSYDVSVVDPANRHAASDDDLVRHALVDFEEIAVLPEKIRDQLIIDLVHAIRFAKATTKARKVGISDKALTQQVFLADVGRAMERAGLRPTRWRKQYDNGGGESLYFSLAREIADVSGLGALPKDPKLLGQLAAQYYYDSV